MTPLIEMLVPALLVSGLALACLKLLPDAPPRLRFAIAGAGLAAWAVPWPWIALPFAVPGAAAAGAWLDGTLLRAALEPALDGGAGLLDTEPFTVAAPPRGALDVDALVAFAVAGAFAWGLARLAADWIALRRTLADWRMRSRDGDALRAWLPEPLRPVRARIRIVTGTRVAAASGVLAPTVWIGDGFRSERELRLALLHECAHAASRDPLWTAAIVAVARVWWWNPIVARLAREAELMLECACDRRCIEWIAPRRYAATLAGMMLPGAPATHSPLAPAARGRSFDVVRLDRLTRDVILRVRDVAVVATFAAAAVLSAGVSATAAHAARSIAKPDWSAVAIPRTPAGRALAGVLDAHNHGDYEQLALYLGAYTPQEVAFPAPRGARVDVRRIVGSTPHSIRWLASGADGAGAETWTLEVDAADPMRIMRVERRGAAPL